MHPEDNAFDDVRYTPDEAAAVDRILNQIFEDVGPDAVFEKYDSAWAKVE